MRQNAEHIVKADYSLVVCYSVMRYSNAIPVINDQIFEVPKY